MTAISSRNGHLAPDATVARVVLRPIGSSLPLGAFALVPSGLLLSGLQLGWFTDADAKSIPFLLLGYAVPMQLIACVFAFLARDSLVGTAFGVFSGTWLAYGITGITSGVTQTSHVLGVFFLAVGGLLAMLSGGAIVGGKIAAGAIVVAGSARFILSGLYELMGSSGLEQAAGIVGLVFVGVAAYTGLAALLEDNARRPILPVGRRGLASVAISEGLNGQVEGLEHEAGVREQL